MTHLRHSFRLLSQIQPYVRVLFVAVTTLALFVPWNPDMPDKGITPSWIASITQARQHSQSTQELARLDQSWMFALNAAVAQHLRFGKDIIFPFGPYASVFTRSYHPATDRLMLGGSLLLAVSYTLVVLYLTRGNPPFIAVFLVLFSATFTSPDALLLSYPFILIVALIRCMTHHDLSSKDPVSWRQLLGLSVALSALGLLPLIKGSLLIPAVASATILDVCFIYIFPSLYSIPLLLVPIVASLVCWVCAGQRIIDLLPFCRGIEQLTSGYTEAMAIGWVAWPPIIGYIFILIYITSSALVCVSISRSRLSRVPRWLLGLVCLFNLFVAFKHGFVRTDHVLLAFDFLAIVILSLFFLYRDRILIITFIVVTLIVAGISFREDPVLVKEVRQSFGVGTAAATRDRRELVTFIFHRALPALRRTTYQQTLDTYHSAYDGIVMRLFQRGALDHRFSGALSNIGNEYSVKMLTGTADIYTYEAPIIIASPTRWNPRPVFQSYSAYTPALSRLNEQHLRATGAPDWVLFDLFSTDKHFPSLEDGLSWTALLDNYTFTSFDGQFATLHKNQLLIQNSPFAVVYQGTPVMNSRVALPAVNCPLYAQISFQRRFVGHLLTILFSEPEITMSVNLYNGSVSTYRIIPGMAATGFMISPLVENTEQFAALLNGDRRIYHDNGVESISVTVKSGASICWRTKYLLTVKAYNCPD